LCFIRLPAGGKKVSRLFGLIHLSINEPCQVFAISSGQTNPVSVKPDRFFTIKHANLAYPATPANTIQSIKVMA
jgi:hypothetical protein